MKIHEFTALMERIAPRELALEFDNPGLLIEPDHAEITRVLVALDCTKAVAEEAAEGVGLQLRVARPVEDGGDGDRGGRALAEPQAHACSSRARSSLSYRAQALY